MSELRFFQFLRGERRGEVVVMNGITAEDDFVFVEFKDGSRCNQTLIAPLNEKNVDIFLMAEISDPNNVWKFETKTIGGQEEKWAEDANGARQCVQPFLPGKTTDVYIPPKPSSNFGKVTNNVATVVKQEVKIPTPVATPEDKYKDDPVWVMLNKSKKFDTDISLELSIALPKKQLFSIIDESFEQGGKKMIDFIIETMNIDKIKESLKIALLNSYSDSQVIPNYEPDVIEEPQVSGPILNYTQSKDELG